MNHLEQPTTYLIKDVLCKIGNLVCKNIYHSLQNQSLEELSSIYKYAKEDTIYQIDHHAEKIIIPLLEMYAESLGGIVLIAEGISNEDNPCVFPIHLSENEAKWKVIIDPIDGTKVLMYQKRSGFFLAGAAPNLGANTRLEDIEVAVMTELPTAKALYSDTFWAIKGTELSGYSVNLLTGEQKERQPSPSKAQSIKGGFGQLTRFYAPARDLIAKIEDELLERLFPDMADEQAVTFEDQYISTGGQLYELLVGHDRFVADLRPLLYHLLKKQGKRVGHTAHPYDFCTYLIAKEAGIIITDARGKTPEIPMDTSYQVHWIAYANQYIQNEVENVLLSLLRKYNLIEK
jgi:hypothetical protein